MIHLIVFRAMGCQTSIQLEADATGAALLQAMPRRLAAIEAALTRFDERSELMGLNARAGEWVPVSEVLFENVHAAKHAARLTEGLYNPLVLPALIANGYDRSFEQIVNPTTAPVMAAADWQQIGLRLERHEVRIPAGSALDLGGVAKGWTSAYLARELAAYGPCLVNIGGDMTACGAPEGLPGWPVEVEDPVTSEAFVAIDLNNSSIATSGIDYRRWQSMDGSSHHHIIDPRSGRPATSDVLAVTVIHPHAPTAEAYCKAVLLRGSDEGLNWLNQQWQAAALVFRRDGAAIANSTFTTLAYERNAQP